MRHLLLGLLLTLITSPILAQDLQGWLIYFGNTKIKDTKFSIHHELQWRDFKLIGDHNQSLGRLGAQYQLSSKLTGTLGYGLIYTEVEAVPNQAFVENRIYQEMLFAHPIGSAKLRHRFRLEERFIEGQDFRGRFRYCLFADIPLTSKGFAKNGSYLALYDEIFLNLSTNQGIKVFDRNRAYVGVGHKLRENLGAQLGYMRQNVGKVATSHVLVSLHHNFKL